MQMANQFTHHICINLCKSVIQLPENINRNSQFSRNTNVYIAPKRSVIFFSKLSPVSPYHRKLVMRSTLAWRGELLRLNKDLCKCEL